MNYFAISLATLILSVVAFFILGALGFTDYIDGLVMSIGLIITILLSVIIGLLIKINGKIKKNIL
ncbi:hypothetical protein [Planococcus dechangensis]|uniref:Uncharacterized protein n=1 Tax=Planococcus dechangensis TaxID=1176255 RepID=A0ABV9M7J7_9BACL